MEEGVRETGPSSLVSLTTAHYRLWCRRGLQVAGSTVPDFGFLCPIWRYGTLQTCFSAAMRPHHSPWSMGRMDEEMAFMPQSARLRCRSGRSVFCVRASLQTAGAFLSFLTPMDLSKSLFSCLGEETLMFVFKVDMGKSRMCLVALPARLG